MKKKCLSVKSRIPDRPVLAILLLVILVFPTRALSGQGLLKPGEAASDPETDTAAVRISAFDPSRITEEFDRSFRLISEAGKAKSAGNLMAEVASKVDTTCSAIDLFLSDTTLADLSDAGIGKLDHVSLNARLHTENVQELQDRVSGMASATREAIRSLDINRKEWELTLEKNRGEEIPETRLDRISRVAGQLDSVRSLLQTDLDLLITLQDRVAERRNALESLNNRIRVQRSLMGERLFRREASSLFRDLATLKDSSLIANHASHLVNGIRADVAVFRSRFVTPVVFMNLLFLAFLVFAVWYKKHFARLIAVERFELSDVHMAVIYYPVVSVLFITTLLVRLFFPDFPQTFRSLNLIILMIPMLVMVIRLYGSLARRWMTALVVIYSLSFLYELIYYPSVLLRLILLAFSISALVLFTWMILKKPLEKRFRNSFLYQVYRFTLAGLCVMLFIAVIANLAGAVRLAEFFTLAPIQIAVLAIGIQVAIRVIDTVVFLVLASNQVQRLNVFRDGFQVVYRKTARVLNILLWVFFVVNALNVFRVKNAVFEWGGNVLNSGWKLGEVVISPASILIFILVIWLSIVITRIVKAVLEKDVFARIQTSRGTPSTVILLVRIALIAGGFLLAARAAGMKLTNLSIVLGAFSVGIGFGLQNIFNNMVSGLILAFERPIKVGDVVQVGELLGEVLSIGLRSSTVRSFDGAEVIVPNGNLISDQMINWTLSDSNRRMDLRVGVAYGTNPEKVIDLIQEVALKHTRVDRKPAPKAFFLGFGESSLDFRLLAWTNIDHRLEVESELNVGINNALKEAGIEIPFPQRDIHLRSDQTRGSEG